MRVYNMVKNRGTALVFRTGALVFALLGLMKQLGIFNGSVNMGHFMYYTILSNILAVVLFALLITRTASELREGIHGRVDWYSRFEMICVVDLLVTMVVFWALLVPFVDAAYLWTFENIVTHTVTPLLCLTDLTFTVSYSHISQTTSKNCILWELAVVIRRVVEYFERFTSSYFVVLQ